MASGRRILRSLLLPTSVGTAAAGKPLTMDANKAIAGITTLGVTTINATTVNATNFTGAVNTDTKLSTADPAPASTVLVDIAGLSTTLTAGATYKFRCVLTGLADATSGVSYAFKYTTATLTSIAYTAIMYTASAVSTTSGTTTTDATLLADKAAALTVTILEGTMVVNAGGSVKMQAATHTGTTAASVVVGSSMTFTRIA